MGLIEIIDIMNPLNTPIIFYIILTSELQGIIGNMDIWSGEWKYYKYGVGSQEPWFWFHM